MADRDQMDEQANGMGRGGSRGTMEQRTDRDEINRRHMYGRGNYGEGSPGGYGTSGDAGRGTMRDDWDRGTDDRSFGARDAGRDFGRDRDFGRGENLGSTGWGSQSYGTSGGFGQSGGYTGGNTGGYGTGGNPGGYTGGYGSSGAWGGRTSGSGGGYGQGGGGQGSGQSSFGPGPGFGGYGYTGGPQEHRGYGGYGAGEYGGSYGGMGAGRSDWNPSSGGTSGGSSGHGSMLGSAGMTSGWSQGGPHVAGAYGLHTLATQGAIGGRGEFSGDRERGRDAGRWIREGALVRDVMTKDVKTLHPDATVAEAARLMREEDTGIIPVVSEGRVAGVVTDRDLAIRVLAEGKDPATCKVSDVMTDDVHVVSSDDRLVDAVRTMGEENVRRLPVVDRDDRLRGVLSMSDVAREAELDYALQEALERIAARRSFWSRW